MHVDDAVRRDIDYGLRDDLAVANYHHGVRCERGEGRDGFGTADALGLVDGEGMAQRSFFHGRGGELPASSTGTVGLGDYGDYVLAGGDQGFQGGDGEFRGT